MLMLILHHLVFETELVDIEGVSPPEDENKKEADTEAHGGKAGEKVASVISEATEAARTLMADTDDAQGHEEL